MRFLALLPLLSLAALPQDAIKTQVVDYKHGDVGLQGYLAWDESFVGKRPGVLVIHEWRGHGDYVRRRAEQLARLGYVAFALDMYGKGVFAKDHQEAGKLAGVFFGDRNQMRARAKAGYDVLAKHELVAPGKIAAMGYCFGGTASIEMARAGFDLAGVASFHGNLSTPQPAKSVKAKVIVFHGAEDGFIPQQQVDDFHKEMREAKADWQFVSFGGAVHSFTVREAGDDPSKGMAYDAAADRRSWEMLRDFLAEAFAGK